MPELSATDKIHTPAETVFFEVISRIHPAFNPDFGRQIPDVNHSND
jgi:hypothetical protein